MSLETEINALTLAVQSLTAVAERLAGAPVPAAAAGTAPEPEPVATQSVSVSEAPKRTRRTKAEIEAEEAAKKDAEAAATPAPAPEPVKEEDPFADAFGDAFAEPAPKVYTAGEVQTAFIELAKSKGRDVAIGVLKQYSTTNMVSGIPADKYAAVMADIEKAKG